MENNQLQITFFQFIKSKLPPNISFVDEMADLLHISIDSAYRRIRGEKIISFEDIRKIAAHYNLSVDQLLNIHASDVKIFTGNYISSDNFSFDMYLQKMLEAFMYLNSFKNRELIHFCKDIVIFYYFAYPELAAFKNFAWMKTILNLQNFNHSSFSADIFTASQLETSAKIARQYTIIPGSELMNISNIHTTLYQIEYYKTARKFRSDNELKIIYAQLHKMIDHIEEQAEKGVKFMPGEKENSQSAVYNLYVNDFITGDNSSLATVEGNRISYLVHSHLNYLFTSDVQHTSYHYCFLKTIIEKSVALSRSSEHLRSGFFYLIHEEIDKSENNQLRTFGKI